MKPELIKAIHPADLLEQVNNAIRYGKDMHTPLFVSHEGLLCQWVVPTMCLYEYKLIVAMELDDLERQAVNLIELDYDFFMNTALWNGMYLQWMCRMNNDGLIFKSAAQKMQELRMVEDAQAGLKLAPIARGGHVVTIPYPVNVS